MKRWDLQVDVVVVGSGGAAFSAAIAAHDKGAKVALLERSDKVGGTTAVSGGAMWIPMNSHMKDVKAKDSREEALAYCRRISDGRADDSLIQTFVDNGYKVVDYLEKKTPVRMAAMTMADYHPEEPGGKWGGRSIEPQMFRNAVLGDWKDKVRPNALPFFMAVSCEELWGTYKANINPNNLPIDLILKRLDDGEYFGGNALIGPMLQACLERKVTILMETRALELIREGGTIIGLRAKKEGKDFFIKARGGVILASGGFEWSEELKNKYLPGIVTHPNTPPFNEGDGVKMAAQMGADMINMYEIWGMISVVVPGEEYEGKPYNQLCITERVCPHSIIVNREGKRFVNEAANYNDMSKTFFNVDENGVGFRNLPAFAIMDNQYRANYYMQTLTPGVPDPEWLIKDNTLKGLAKKIGVDVEGLKTTVERFNGFVDKGKDLDFKRGDSKYDQYVGDVTRPLPNLGKIEKAPFYAVQLFPGTLGTKGGPRTNKNGQVMDVMNKVIPGLYAAGNAAAPVSGPGYYGGGTPIGVGVTFGHLAGIHAAKEAKKGAIKVKVKSKK
jgi:3-oxosteroid 1-dehydrogenase